MTGTRITDMTLWVGATPVSGFVVPVVTPDDGATGVNYKFDIGAALAGKASLTALAANTGAGLIGTTGGITVQAALDAITPQLDLVYLPDQTDFPLCLDVGDGLRDLAGPNVNNTQAFGLGALINHTGVSPNANPDAGYGMTVAGPNAAHDSVNAFDCDLSGYEVAYHIFDGFNICASGAKALYTCLAPYRVNVQGVTAFFSATTAFESGGRGTDVAFNATTIRESEIDGYQAAYFPGTIRRSVISGWKAGGGFTGSVGVGTVEDDVVLGYRASGSSRNGVESVIIGRDSAVARRDANGIVSIGAYCLANIVDEDLDTAGGYSCLTLYTGREAAGWGAECLASNVSGLRITGYGYRAGRLATGSDLDLSGHTTAPLLTTGSNITTAGSRSAPTIVGAGNSTFIGAQSDGTANDDNQQAFGFQAVCTKGNQVMLGNGSITEVSTAGKYIANNNDAIPAGGSQNVGLNATSTANFGIFFGSGAPTLSASKGSFYMRSDGSTTNDRAYINTDGGTTWTALTTAA